MARSAERNPLFRDDIALPESARVTAEDMKGVTFGERKGFPLTFDGTGVSLKGRDFTPYARFRDLGCGEGNRHTAVEVGFKWTF